MANLTDKDLFLQYYLERLKPYRANLTPKDLITMQSYTTSELIYFASIVCQKQFQPIQIDHVMGEIKKLTFKSWEELFTLKGDKLWSITFQDFRYLIFPYSVAEILASAKTSVTYQDIDDVTCLCHPFDDGNDDDAKKEVLRILASRGITVK